jgi:hypothetical protein
VLDELDIFFEHFKAIFVEQLGIPVLILLVEVTTCLIEDVL